MWSFLLWHKVIEWMIVFTLNILRKVVYERQSHLFLTGDTKCRVAFWLSRAPLMFQVTSGNVPSVWSGELRNHVSPLLSNFPHERFYLLISRWQMEDITISTGYMVQHYSQWTWFSNFMALFFISIPPQVNRYKNQPLLGPGIDKSHFLCLAN